MSEILQIYVVFCAVNLISSSHYHDVRQHSRRRRHEAGTKKLSVVAYGLCVSASTCGSPCPKADDLGDNVQQHVQDSVHQRELAIYCEQAEIEYPLK